MDNLTTGICEIKELKNVLKDFLNSYYNISEMNILNSLQVFENYINHFKDDLFVFVEYPYVDKVYRDSYYNYYASKKDKYHRDSIRLSLFSSEIKNDDFRSKESYEELKEKYLGFIIIRPTFPQIIGRSLVSPNAILVNDFKICKTEYNVTANSIKLSANGFPHSSQNSETISCAETTLWSIMEYFAYRYVEYKPILPFKISQILNKLSFERLIPSKGLTAQQISFALKEFDFGVKIYSKGAYKNEFENILRSYIESGIPIIALIQNKKGIGHAQIIVGRSRFHKEDIDKLQHTVKLDEYTSLVDFMDIDVNYVFIDDNHPPYQLSKLSSPSSFYDNKKWEGCTITNFIVPLYHKIYLESGEARTITKSLLSALFNNFSLLKNKETIYKTFLTSSRSFKNEIALNETLDNDVKELILSLSMPKFIWITELSDRELILDNLCSGMLIVDATEPKILGLIAGLVENHYISNNLSNFAKISMALAPFRGYQGNIN